MDIASEHPETEDQETGGHRRRVLVALDETDSTFDAPEEAFVVEAADHPVFELQPVPG